MIQKCVDKPFTYTLNTTGQVEQPNLLLAGTGFNNRVGNQVYLEGIDIKASLFLTGNVTNQMDAIRVALVWDQGNNTGAVTVPDILLDTDLNGTTQTTVLSGVNWQNRNRFHIIWDKLFSLPNSNGSTIGPVDTFPYIIDENISLKGLQSFYRETAGSFSTESGALLLIALGSKPPGAGQDAFGISAQTRLYFSN